MTGRQIVPFGPWMPAEVLQAAEEGRLMFFCGAGISRGPSPWGLPDFRELTEFAYQACNQVMMNGRPSDPAACDAFCREQYDKALEILETQAGYAGDMRQNIANRLCSLEGLEQTEQRAERLRRHRALLDLAELRSQDSNKLLGYRLVTTNFDNRFELAGLDLTFNEDGPCLRPPSLHRPSRLVHLHGRIDQADSLHLDLVLTTRDFGNAYLRHGWAARFVVEMFREFIILFIGYSLSDPVMRYLMDVFATERGEQRQFRPAYALVPFRAHIVGDRIRQEQLWKAKRVIPIPYDESYQRDRSHGLLDDTLMAWAAERRLGLAGRFKVAVEATTTPFRAGVDDADPSNALASVVWALDTQEGEIARRFAEHEPSPDISWFGPIVSRLQRRQRPNGNGSTIDPGTVARPAQFLESPVARGLAVWARKNLDSRILTALVCTKPELLFPEFLHEIEWTLRYQQSSIAIPYRLFWQLALTATSEAHQSHPWPEVRVSTQPAFLVELRPRLDGPKPGHYWWFEGHANEAPINLQTLGRFEINHADDYAFEADKLHRSTVQLENEPPAELVDACDALTSILVDWAELAAWIEQPIGRSSSARPYLVQQRVPDHHSSNLDIVIDLTMASFAGLVRVRPTDAKGVAARWRLLGERPHFGIFARLWLWAAADFPLLDPSEVLTAIVDRPDVHWGHEFEAELLRFLRLRASASRHRIQWRLGHVLLRRPPTNSLPGSIGRNELRKFINEQRSLRLWKAQIGGVKLRGRAAALASASELEWSERGYPADAFEIDRPLSHAELAQLSPEPDGQAILGRPIEEVVAALRNCTSEWAMARLAQQVVHHQPDSAVELLRALRSRGFAERPPYSGVFWGLRALAEAGTDTTYLLAQIADAIDTDFELANQCLDGAEDWLKQLQANEQLAQCRLYFWRLWDLLAAVEREFSSERETDERPFDTALNAGGGPLTDILMSEEGRLGGLAGRCLSQEHRARFDRVAADQGAVGVHGRVLLAMQLQWLHAIDPDWTELNVLVRFDWTWLDRAETIRLWRTFAFTPRSGPTLLAKLKSALLQALRCREELGEGSHERLCWFLGTVVAQNPSMFDREQTIAAIRDIGPDGCAQIFRAFEQKLRDAGTSAPSLWQERIAPWIAAHWPVDYDLRVGPIARKAIQVALRTREAFPRALALVQQRFNISEVDDSRMWLFSLYHKPEEQEFDYLASYPVETGRLIASALSRKTERFAVHEMHEIKERMKTIFPEVLPEGWNQIFDRY